MTHPQGRRGGGQRERGTGSAQGSWLQAHIRLTLLLGRPRTCASPELPCPSRWIREATECLLIVGPEGDFTTEELGSLMAAGAIPVGLGDLRLRTETAAIALLSAARLSAEE